MPHYYLDPCRPGEKLARMLARRPDYRILRRLPRPGEFWCQSMPLPVDTLRLGIVDTETTGLDPERHRIIELAIAGLEIDALSGKITDVVGPQSWVEDPGLPLSSEIERLTGITDADLAGRCFDELAVMAAFDRFDLLVAHNAAFDARFLCRRFPRLAHPWACSLREIDWPTHGLAGPSLRALVTSAGHFMPDDHRAFAGANLLARSAGMRRSYGRSTSCRQVDTSHAACLCQRRAFPCQGRAESGRI